MDNEAARKLFDERFVRIHRHLFRFVAVLAPNREDAEELFQEACLKILEKWRDYDAARPMLPWACGIAQNVARRYFERQRRRGLPLNEVLLDVVAETQHRLAAEIDARLQKLPDCLQQLTEEQRLLLEECYSSYGSIKKLAQAKQLDPNVLYKRLERIRRLLFDCIESAITQE